MRGKGEGKGGLNAVSSKFPGHEQVVTVNMTVWL